MKKNVLKTLLVATILATNVMVANSISAANIKNRVRLGGQNRFETAISISKEFEKGDTIENVLICSSDAWADAMSCSPLSAYKNAPILLTEKFKLNPQTKARLKEMKSVKNIIVLGETGIISNDVIKELISMGYNVERIGGKDRYETNAKIMDEIPVEKYGYRPKIVNGMDFNQVLALSADTKTCDWSRGPRGKHPIYINPIFLISPNISKKDIMNVAPNSSQKKLTNISAKLAKSEMFWNKRGFNRFNPQIDSHFMNRMMKNYGTLEYIKLENMFGGNINTVPSSYKHANSFVANANINKSLKSRIIDMPPVVASFKESGALLVNGEIFADSLSVSALSAKRAMPIVLANRQIKDTLRGTDEVIINSYLVNTFKNVQNVYYIGGQAVMPDGRECILNGKDK